MIEEMTVLDDNGTWDLVSCFAEKKTIGCKWVFAIKVDHDGAMPWLSVVFVLLRKVMSKSMKLIIQIHFLPTFFFMAATHDWPLHEFDIHELDIKNAFLHGDL